MRLLIRCSAAALLAIKCVSASHTAYNLSPDYLTEADYQSVAKLGDDEAMKLFVRKYLKSTDRMVLDEGYLSGFVPHYSGTIAVQSLEQMRQELAASNWIGNVGSVEPYSTEGAHGRDPFAAGRAVEVTGSAFLKDVHTAHDRDSLAAGRAVEVTGPALLKDVYTKHDRELRRAAHKEKPAARKERAILCQEDPSSCREARQGHSKAGAVSPDGGSAVSSSRSSSSSSSSSTTSASSNPRGGTVRETELAASHARAHVGRSPHNRKPVERAMTASSVVYEHTPKLLQDGGVYSAEIAASGSLEHPPSLEDALEAVSAQRPGKVGRLQAAVTIPAAPTSSEVGVAPAEAADPIAAPRPADPYATRVVLQHDEEAVTGAWVGGTGSSSTFSRTPEMFKLGVNKSIEVAKNIATGFTHGARSMSNGSVMHAAVDTLAGTYSGVKATLSAATTGIVATLHSLTVAKTPEDMNPPVVDRSAVGLPEQSEENNNTVATAAAVLPQDVGLADPSQGALVTQAGAAGPSQESVAQRAAAAQATGTADPSAVPQALPTDPRQGVAEPQLAVPADPPVVPQAAPTDPGQGVAEPQFAVPADPPVVPQAVPADPRQYVAEPQVAVPADLPVGPPAVPTDPRQGVAAPQVAVAADPPVVPQAAPTDPSQDAARPQAVGLDEPPVAPQYTAPAQPVAEPQVADPADSAAIPQPAATAPRQGFAVPQVVVLDEPPAAPQQPDPAQLAAEPQVAGPADPPVVPQAASTDPPQRIAGPQSPVGTDPAGLRQASTKPSKRVAEPQAVRAAKNSPSADSGRHLPSERRVASAAARAKPVLASSPFADPASALAEKPTLSAAGSAPASRVRSPKGAALSGNNLPQKDRPLPVPPREVTPSDPVSDSLQELRKRENMEAHAIRADATSSLPAALKTLAGYGYGGPKPLSHAQQAEKTVQLEEERFDNIRKQVDFELKRIRRQRVLTERDMERKEKAQSRYQDIEKDLESTKAIAEAELRRVQEHIKGVASSTHTTNH